MVAFRVPARLNLSPAVLAAIAGASAAAAALWSVPAEQLGAAVMASGIPALVPAAEPPLGLFARALIALAAAIVVGALCWFTAAQIVELELAARVRRAVPKREPAPEEPKRAPVLATRDLGTPFLEVKAPPREPVERELPKDLSAPLAAFDPDALPEVPAEPIPVVASLAPSSAIREPGERFEVFALTPPVPAEPPIATRRTDATIQALLARLERGVARRSDSPADLPRPPKGLDSTLAELRRLATN
jgi:hypothetical protein